MSAEYNRRSVEDAVDAMRSGSLVLVLDDRTRENEGDLVVAAEAATSMQVNTMISRGRGLVCVAMSGPALNRLELAPMVEHNSDPHRTAFTVSVDRQGLGTGISASDRGATIRALADPGTRPRDLSRPGHVFPLRSRPGGVFERRGHTEAAVDLATLAGLTPAAAICEVLGPDGDAATRDQLVALAAELDIPIVDIADIAAHRREPGVGQPWYATTTLPTRHGEFTVHVLREGDLEHLVLVHGDPGGPTAPLVRVHSECVTGDVLGSLRCDCGEQLDAALSAVAAAGRGVVVYLRGQEGRGIGLGDKIRAYALQDRGRDTVQANLELGLPVDSRSYAAAADALCLLGIPRVELLTNNPDKVAGLTAHGVDVVRRVDLQTLVHPENEHYLATKRQRMGHQLTTATTDRGAQLPHHGGAPAPTTEGTQAC